MTDYERKHLIMLAAIEGRLHMLARIAILRDAPPYLRDGLLAEMKQLTDTVSKSVGE